MSFVRENIKKAIDQAESDEELGKYLARVAKVLNKSRYKVQTKTLAEEMRALLENRAPRFTIELQDRCFRGLTDFFCLTPGLHVIGAPSAHGKTLWAMEWAKACANAGEKVLMVSLEMSGSDLGARTLSSASNLPLSKLVKGDLPDGAREALKSLTEEMCSFGENIHIDTLGEYDWVKIEPRMSDLMMRLKPKLVIVDYAQMIYDSGEKDYRASKVLGEVARDLKLFADNTQSAVLLLSQINRDGFRDIRGAKLAEIGHVPLSNEFIKESGGIVEAADSVQMVCIPSRLPRCPLDLLDKFQVTVDKSRRLGELGTVLIEFDTTKMRFPTDETKPVDSVSRAQ